MSSLINTLSGGRHGLFGRKYQVVIGTVEQPAIAAYGNIGSTSLVPLPGDVQASALRVEFDIVKNCIDTPNKGSLRITNMAPQTRSALRPGMQVKLTVGYIDEVQLLFQAGIFLVKTDRSNAEILTSIELMDGDAAIFNLNFDKTYGPMTPVAQIFRDIITTLATPTPSCPTGIKAGAITGLPKGFITNSYAAHGSIRNTLNDLCRNEGLEWSIQNGAIQIVPQDSHGGDTGEMISASTGMLGVPSFDGSTLMVSCLLNPRLVPGKLVKVESKDINGTFKIRSGHWVGDSHGDHWGCELECVPMGSAAGALSSNLGQNLKDLAKATKAVGKKTKKDTSYTGAKG